MDTSIPATYPPSQSRAGEGSGSDDTAASLSFLSDAAPQQQQRLVYTTAGTLWNPESARPFRAPVRRGRASLGSFGSAGGDQWALLPRHDGENAFHLGPVPSAVPKYSPLQQNNDRAVSPQPLPLLPQRENPVPTGYASFAVGARIPRMRTDDMARTQRSSQGDTGHISFEADDDDGSPSFDEAIIPEHLGISSSSYGNANQQRAVLYAGPTPGPPMRATPTPFKNQNEVVGLKPPQRPLPQAMSSQILPVQPASVKARSLLDYPPFVPKSQTNGQTTQSRQLGSFTSSILASGPGAPEPLKAGPPGQRQQGPSRIESTYSSSSFAGGVNQSLQHPGTYHTQSLAQYPILGMPREAGGYAIAGSSRHAPIIHHGYDGAASRQDHTSSSSEHSIAFRDSILGVRPGLSTSNATGERVSSEVSSRVTSTPPCLGRQVADRSQRNSSQSARSESAGLSLHHPNAYNAIPDRQSQATQPLLDHRPGPHDQALPVQQLRRMDSEDQNMAHTVEARSGRFVGPTYPKASDSDSYNSTEPRANENRGSNILQGTSVGASHVSTAAIDLQGKIQDQLGATASATAGGHIVSMPRDADYWYRDLGRFEPHDGDQARYDQPCFGEYPYGATAMTDQMLREREAKIDAWFYSNTSRLSKTMDEALEEHKHPRARPSPFGSIGDGRPGSSPEPKKTYPPISIKEANEMPTSEHAKPLLSLAFQAILEHHRAKGRGYKAKGGDGDRDKEQYEKMGSAALLPGSFSDTD